ncbi:hypothetical protein K493DRAFT_335675 [Basidiobolus meristosporus CBS 931.73]|uniref:RNA polymerase III RPC4-domain-containing protein n=1 Tax=Basidiobolus meristosporus CBS 931.73 TaxID=1314790 RepID=A0A1Y1YNR4_9FUNG|nr:hypothetical protein K493DRAFT_335675 [Basidiobolus meristosporus CBS 931.73]|eukprot:ORX99659.1 hypothetical protein K493DRAFT_335675 [Basidiobolus meristosporus CBS 931.73]
MSEQKTDSSRPKHNEVHGSLENFRQIGSFHSQPPAVGRLGSIRAKNYTKTGTQKMKFTPTVPLKRNKKESTPSLLENAMSNKSETTSTQRRGRGRGRAKGRAKEMVLTASGPFSMGPTVQVAGSKGYKSGAENSREILVRPSGSNITVSESYDDKAKYEESDDEGNTFFVDQNEWTPIMLPATHVDDKGENENNLDQLAGGQEQVIAMEVDEEKPEPVQSLLDIIMKEQNASGEAGEEKLLFFQFPSQFPDLAESTSFIKQESEDAVQMNSEPADKMYDGTSRDESKIEKSAEGLMGKLLVYKSGKMQIKIGDIYLDLNSGLDCSFAQNVVAVDSDNKQAFVMGGIHKRLICTPNMDSLLS